MLIAHRAESAGHYIVIETVGVKFLTNNVKRGCNNPTKTSTSLPSILVLPSFIIIKDYVIECVSLSIRE
jgi:hypothetical protein